MEISWVVRKLLHRSIAALHNNPTGKHCQIGEMQIPWAVGEKRPENLARRAFSP
jgi:hypothetical protein